MYAALIMYVVIAYTAEPPMTRSYSLVPGTRFVLYIPGMSITFVYSEQDDGHTECLCNHGSQPATENTP